MDRELHPGTRLRNRLRRLVRPLAALCVVLLAGSWAVGRLRPGVDRVSLRTARVSRNAVEGGLTATGTVVPAAEALITSPINGRLLRVLRQAGAQLVVGEPILSLDASEAETQRERLDAEIARLEGRLRELDLEVAEAVAERTSQARLKSLDLEQLRYQLEQHRQLHDEGIVAQAQLEQSRTLVEKTRLELDLLEESRHRIRARLAEQRRAAEAELASARGERRAVARKLALATTPSPLAGVLTWVLDGVGSAVRQGDLLARVAQLDHYRVEAAVSDLHAERLRAGLTARVRLAEDAVLDGRVDRVLPSVEDGAARFSVDLAGRRHPRLKPNLRVEVFVVTESRPDVLTLPRTASLAGGAVEDVFVVEGSVARRRSVRFGLAGLDRCEVVSGVAEGDEVVVSDLSGYREHAELALR